MASHNSRRHLFAWSHCVLVPETSTLRALPRQTVSPATPGSCRAAGMAIPEDDWHLMFDAVKSRLSAVVCTPATAALAVAECLDALDWLQKQLPRAGTAAR